MELRGTVREVVSGGGVTRSASTIAPRIVSLKGTDAMAASSSSSTGGEQQYSLRWNDFQSSILSSVRQLRDVEDFVDVTLACDSCSFTAHKIVLSACSPYFRNLLKVRPFLSYFISFFISRATNSSPADGSGTVQLFSDFFGRDHEIILS